MPCYEFFFGIVVQCILFAPFITSQSLHHSPSFPNYILTNRFTASKHRCSTLTHDWLECILRCNIDSNCVSYQYNTNKGICVLNSFGLPQRCDRKSLVYSEGVVFQQLREEKNQVQFLSEMTCASQMKVVSQTVRASCNDIMVNGESRGDGEYSIKPLGSDELVVYCDMTTDGGGWTLVKKTVLSTTSPSTEVMLTSNWQSIAKYSDPKLIIQPSALKALKASLGFKQMRWLCIKKSVNRKVHIMTSLSTLGENVIKYFTESPPTPAKACHSFSPLPDDTSELAKSCSGWGTDSSFADDFDEWGRRDFNGETRVHRDVIVWLKNVLQEYYFSMYPGRYLCDDKEHALTSINDTWAYYVR